MIEKIFYSDDTTYIIGKHHISLQTHELNVEEAMRLAFQIKADFEIDVKNEYNIRQGIHALSNIYDTKSLFDIYNDLNMHMLNDNVIKGFKWDMSNGMTEVFCQILNYKNSFKNFDITDELIEDYVRTYIINQLEKHMLTKPQNKTISKKYIELFGDKSNSIKDIGHEIRCDNDDIYLSKIISWIDVSYSRNTKDMVLSAYNPHGNLIFEHTIKNITKAQAEETYQNFYNGMKSADIYIDW